MTDCFGKRYVSEKEFLDYARDLDLFTDHPAPRILEFLERHGILNPAARIRFPPEVVRRWHKERYPAADVPDPIEDDTPRLTAARTLHSEIFDEHWSRAEIYGERVHLLDDVPPAQAPFVQINFDPSLFMPWEEFQTIVQMSGDKGIGDSGIYARTCYHYWHVFPLAAFLRSGITILYDLNDRALSRELWEFRIADSSHEKLFATMNLEARHELSKILDRATLFEAVAYFEAYQQNALQKHLHSVDSKTGKLPQPLWREYRKRCRELVLRVSHLIQPTRVGTRRRAVSRRSAANHPSDSVH